MIGGDEYRNREIARRHKTLLRSETSSWQDMHIVGSFTMSGIDGQSLRHELTLCTVRATSSHTFEMKPGFNSQDQPYHFTLEDGTRYE
jgi:hypothetical protein